MTIGSFAFAGPSVSTSLIVLSPSAGHLLPVVLNIIKLFHIIKSVTSVHNTNVTKNLKSIICIAEVPFPFLDKA